ncbi:MAG: entericidin A/B family lipoprotein [Oceanicaulis sp.]
MKTLSPLLILAAALALAGCNTIQGVGQDITRTGEVLEDLLTEADVPVGEDGGVAVG